MVEKQNTEKTAPAVSRQFDVRAKQASRTSGSTRERRTRPPLTDCAARTLARRLVAGLEQARAIIDVAVLTLRYYEEPASAPPHQERAKNAEKAKQLIAAFGDASEPPSAHTNSE